MNHLLIEARKRAGLSQIEVAEQIGIAKSTLNRWEHEKSFPYRFHRQKLCALFHKTEQELGLFPKPPEPFFQSLPLLDPLIPLLPETPLIGRGEELAYLQQQLCQRSHSRLTALNGLPGVGKTALAITLAHNPAIRAHFKDGILWAGLGREANLQSHLSRWGTLLGLSSSEMSQFHDNQAWAVALHRTIGSRTLLLVIDDAWTLEEALILKVGGPNCALVVTTRSLSIATQIAAEGAMTIKELNSDEGMVLLRVLAPRVVENEMQRSRELVMAVGGLPLALHLMGNYLHMQSFAGPARRVTAALEKLSNAGERLNISEPRGPVERHPSLSSDTSVSLRAVISVTDQQLEKPTRRVLYALSVFPPKPTETAPN
jgi:transcriptional regulator with XRE-family HTH domain